MQSDLLRDLELAGVRWELGEVPFVSAQKFAAALVHNDSPAPQTVAAPDVPAVNVPDMNRTATSVVPPIAPVISISVDTAAAMAARPTDINALLRMISEFNHPLRSGATNVVLPNIATNPNGLVIITDIPSGDDDASGSILSGAAGDLLDKMLIAIGMTRENVSILPMVFWRTPGGRTPSQGELELARPFVNRLLEFLSPRVILTLGTLPATEIAGVSLPRAHGVATMLDSSVACMPIFHPNYLILKPTAKRDAWAALQSVEKLLKNAEK